MGIIQQPPAPGLYVWMSTANGRSNFYIHPQRKPADNSNDVALVKMEPIPDNVFSSPYVAIVKLPRSDQMNVNLTGQIATVSKKLIVCSIKNCLIF
jgi:hypothetical protein